MRIRRCIGAIAILSLIPTGIGLALTVSQAGAVTPATTAVGTVYQTTGGGDVVLGTCGPPYPCVLATTGVIPEGSYTVVGGAAIAMGPAATTGSEEGTVCGIGTTASSGDTITGGGGVTCNGASRSGKGGDGVYGGNAVQGTVVINNPHDHITLSCGIATNSSSSQGTYAFAWDLISTKVASIVSSN
jgi:hypothetical protein